MKKSENKVRGGRRRRRVGVGQTNLHQLRDEKHHLAQTLSRRRRMRVGTPSAEAQTPGSAARHVQSMNTQNTHI
jgi:hypothetical protein